MSVKNLFFLLIPVVLLASCLNDDSWKEYEERQKIILEQLAADTTLIVNYLQEKNLPAIKHDSWIYYHIADSGTGSKPNIYSTVSVQYKGYLLNNNVFDETTDGKTAMFYLGNLIGCWQIGLPLIGKGGKIILYSPSYYGYGTSANAKIPANSVLVFEISLIDFL